MNKKIQFSNVDKILFGKSKLTKGDLIEYYEKIADRMLALIKNHPVTLHRFPEGIHGEGFYQKDMPAYYPEWMNYVDIEHSHKTVRYVVVKKAATLVYLANQVCTPHILLTTANKLYYPDRMVFDLDPAGKATFVQVKWAAKKIKEFLDSYDLPAFAMTTGSRGIHVVVPLKQNVHIDKVHDISAAIARELVSLHPERFTVEMRKNKRGNKIFIDALRNAFSATAVAPYAVRAKEGAPVATPIAWNELGKIKKADQFTITNLFRRLSKVKDPWKEFFASAISLKGFKI